MSPKRLAHFSVLIAILILAACTVTSFTGTTSVAVGQQATYDIGVQGSGPGTAEVYVDVPVGWTVSSATWTGTVNGQDASGTASTDPADFDSACNGAPAAGYQRVRFSADFPNGTSSDSGTLHVVFDVGGSPGTYTLQAFGAGIAQGSTSETCSDTTPHTLQVTVVGTAVAKAFSPLTIGTGDTSTLTVTLSNPGGTASTNVSFTDLYPGSVVNAPSPNASSTCGGTVTAAAGSAYLQLSGGTIPAAGTCTVTTLVTSPKAGSFTNTIGAGAVTTSNGSNAVAASATLDVFAHPTVAKSFSPSTVFTGSDSTLTITLTNPNSDTATSVAFTDTLPAGMAISSSPNASTTCGGTVTASPGSNTLQLANGQILGSDRSCTVTTAVTATAGGSLTNTIPAGGVTTSLGSNNVAASATLTSIAPPSISKSFAPSAIAAGATSTLTVTLSNGNSVNATSAAFTDTLPAGVVVAATPNAATTCGGTVTASGSTLQLSGGTIPANGSCTVSASVTGSTPGSYTNTIAAGALTASSGSNASPATATLTVLAPPSVAKSFTPPTILTRTNSTLTVTLTNPNGTVLTGAAFTDTYPSGVVNASSPNAGSTCGGTVTAAPNGNSVALTNGTIPANGSCTVTVSLTTSQAGTYQNTIPAGAVTTSSTSPNTTAATATLTATPFNSIPTLDGRALAALAAALAVIGAMFIRRG